MSVDDSSSKDSPEGKIIPFELPDSRSLGTLYLVIFELGPMTPLLKDNRTAAYFLYMWLYADSHESAGSKATTILRELPYTRADSKKQVIPCPLLGPYNPALDEYEARLREHERIARSCGLSVMLGVGVAEPGQLMD